MGAAAREGQRKGDFLAGKYLLEDCLGVGGMGEVYRATNLSIGRKVAIKLLNAEYIHNEDDVLRFLREARAAAAIRHPNVVDVLDVARDDDGTPFIVQELLTGVDLEQHLRSGSGTLSPNEAIEIMIPVADALAAAHAQNVVHRDLKPANVFLAKEGTRITPKVLDFGACLYQTVGGITTRERRMLIGTPHYMAPEQIVAKSTVDVRADVWALGILIFELIVGDTPFEADDANAVLKLVRTTNVPPLRSVGADVPLALEELVVRCTQRDKERRLPNAGAVRDELEAIKKGYLAATRDRLETAPEIDLPPAAVVPALGPRVPSLARPGGRRTTRRGSSLLTLSQPGETDPPPSKPEIEPPLSAERPIEAARPSYLPSRPFSAPPRSAEGNLEFDSSPKVDLHLGAPPKWRSEPPIAGSPTEEKRRVSMSSLPPVLDPRAASSPSSPPSARPAALPSLRAPTRSVRPPASAASSASNPPPLTMELESSARASRNGPSSSRLEAALPPARESARDSVRESALSPPPVSLRTRPTPMTPVTVTRDAPWPPGAVIPFALAIVVPAIAAFFGLRLAPALTAPLGHALRGDAPLASGVLAVAALIVAAVLAAKTVAGSRERSLMVATGGALLFGIVMIIVTFSASEAIEAGMPSTGMGIAPFVAPVAPLGLGVAAMLRAKRYWRSAYEQRDARSFVALASLMLLLALELGPIGAARTVSPPPAPAKTAR